MQLRLSSLVLTALLSSAVHANPVSSVPSGLKVSMQPTQTPVPLNQMHSWTVLLKNSQDEPVADAQINVNGGMPAHDHGLATSPRVTRYLGEGQYLLEGVRFHMPGEWLMKLDIQYLDQSFTAEIPVTL